MQAERIIFEFVCVAEDAWSWIALLCGNHLGHLGAFIGL
jgi:hypothetical protein